MSKKRAMLIGLDGADPLVLKRLMDEGRLPNMKKVAEQGAHTEKMDMQGVFPTVTPPNWTTLATGNYPRTHGITCFGNHTLGKPLSMGELNWDSRRVESELIWEAFEDEDKRCIMLNYCQAWPNRVHGSKNVFVDGTGVIPFLRSSADFQKHVILDQNASKLKEVPHNVRQGSGDCVVYGDQIEKVEKKSSNNLEAMVSDSSFKLGNAEGEETPLMDVPAFVMMDESVEEASNKDVVDEITSPLKPAHNWGFEVAENALEGVYVMNDGLDRRNVLLTASNGKDYDTITVYRGKKQDKPLGSAKVGEWTEWIYDSFHLDDEATRCAYKIRVMSIAADGSNAEFYISHTLNLENDIYFYPKELGKELFEAVGPAMYFGIFKRHTEIGDKIILETWEQNIKWHIDATKYLFDKYNDWQLFYTHLHAIDLMNHWYINQAIPGSHPDWQRHRDAIESVYVMYDEYIGEMLNYLDGDTTMFIVSDHAATPRSVGYSNPGLGELSGLNCKVMSDLGYTKMIPIDPENGLWDIDWTQTKAVNHRTSYIYINLKGRDPDGIVEPEDYDALVQQIISDLYAYRDPVHGERVVSFAMTREEMESVGMGGKHCGDIFFQMRPDFQFEHANCPNNVTNHGYSVGCVCLMAGNGIKQGTLERPIRNVDIVPTICQIVGNRMPKNVEGGVIYQALK